MLDEKVIGKKVVWLFFYHFFTFYKIKSFPFQKRLTLFCSHVIMMYITEILHIYYVLLWDMYDLFS